MLLWQCLPLLLNITETPTLSLPSMSIILKEEEEAGITPKEAEVADLITTISILSLMHLTKAIHSTHSMLRQSQMVPGLNARSVANLDIKHSIATIVWTLHTKAGIHLQNWQQWLQSPMILKVEKLGLLIQGPLITSQPT
jgi:hypothetical protein